MRGKKVCATHGGKSTGPKTEQGKANSAKANTLSSKSIVVETTRSAVDLKVFIEQMREQIQNIE